MKIKIKIKVLRKNQPTDVKLDEKLGKTKKPSEANQMTKKKAQEKEELREPIKMREPPVLTRQNSAHIRLTRLIPLQPFYLFSFL